jgi:hypothetical protein
MHRPPPLRSLRIAMLQRNTGILKSTFQARQTTSTMAKKGMLALFLSYFNISRVQSD